MATSESQKVSRFKLIENRRGLMVDWKDHYSVRDGIDWEWARKFTLNCRPDKTFLGRPSIYVRHFAADESRLFNLGTLEWPSYYPASQTTIGENQIIISEAPQSSMAQWDYYQMVIQSGAELLVSAKAEFQVDESSGQIKIDPKVYFLRSEDEKMVVTVNGEKNYIVQCSEETVYEIPREIASEAGRRYEKISLHYWIRQLEIWEESQEWNKKIVFQILPDFTPVSYPLSLTVFYVAWLKNFAREKGVSSNNFIVSCEDGLNQSAQLALVFGVLNDLERETLGKSPEEIGDFIDAQDWPEIFIDRALIINSQTVPGGAIESINQTLLPNVTLALSQRHQGKSRIYDPKYGYGERYIPVSDEEKKEVQVGIKNVLKEYMRVV